MLNSLGEWFKNVVAREPLPNIIPVVGMERQGGSKKFRAPTMRPRIGAIIGLVGSKDYATCVRSTEYGGVAGCVWPCVCVDHKQRRQKRTEKELPRLWLLREAYTDEIPRPFRKSQERTPENT